MFLHRIRVCDPWWLTPVQNLCKYPILQKDFTDPIFFFWGGGGGDTDVAQSEERCDVTKIQICEIMGLVSILRKNYEKKESLLAKD